MSLWSVPNLTTPGLWTVTWRHLPQSHFLPLILIPFAPSQSTASSVQPLPHHPLDLDPPTPPWLTPSGASWSPGGLPSQLTKVRRTPLCTQALRQGLLESGSLAALYRAQEAPCLHFPGNLPTWRLLMSSPLSPTPGTYLSRERCQVASGHIPCIVRRSSKEACQQAGCCYDNTREVPCYYGNTGTTFHTKHDAIL